MRVIDAFRTELSREQVLEELNLKFSSGEVVEQMVHNMPFAKNPARTLEQAERWAVRQWLLFISNPRNHVRLADKQAFIQQRITDWYEDHGI